MIPGGAAKTFITFTLTLATLLACACAERQACGPGTLDVDGVCQVAPRQDSAAPDLGLADQGPTDLNPPDLALPDLASTDQAPSDLSPPPDTAPWPPNITGKVTRFGVTNHAGTKVTLSPGGVSALTKADGTYAITGVKQGIYTLTATYAYHQAATAKNIVVIPASTFQAPQLQLVRYKLLKKSVAPKVFGIQAQDKYAFWLENSGLLTVASLPSGAATVMAKDASWAELLSNRTHVIYKDNKNTAYILELGAGASIKLADDVTGWKEIAPGNWLRVETKNKGMRWVSPDGKKNYQITSSYIGFTELLHAGVLLVLAKDGLFSLPRSGGPPVTLDSQAGTSYCKRDVASSGCYSMSAVIALTQDQKRTYYLVHRPATAQGELRSVSTAKGPAVTLAKFDLKKGHTAHASMFGKSPHLLLKSTGTTGGVSWQRYHTVPVAGGKLVLAAEQKKVSGGQVVRAYKTSPAGNAMGFIITPWLGGNSYLNLVTTDGKVSKSVGKMNISRPYAFSGDGKRLVWSPRDSSNPSSTPALMSIATDGTDLRTHLKDTRSLFTKTSCPNTKEPTLTALSHHMLLRCGGTIMALPYTATSGAGAKELTKTCGSGGKLDSAFMGSVLVKCTDQVKHGVHIFNSPAGTLSFVGNGTFYTVNNPSKSRVKLFTYRTAGGLYIFPLVDFKTGKVVPLFSHPISTGKTIFNWVSPGKYAMFFYPAWSSKTASDNIFCVDMETMAITKGGIWTGSSIYKRTGPNGVDYYLYLSEIKSASAIRSLTLKTCKLATLGSAGVNYFGAFMLGSPDRKTVAYRPNTGTMVAPITGGKGLLISGAGYPVALGNKVLYYSEKSSTGSVTRLMATPINGGTPTGIIDVSSFYSLTTRAGQSDLVFNLSDLYYVDMP